jgi:putative FmdB family regulatory protein
MAHYDFRSLSHPTVEERVMPTYQYRCVECGETFERVEHISEHGQSQPRCPKCESQKTEPQPAAFFAKTSRKS